MTTATQYPATEEQISYLERTLTQHNLHSNHYARLWAMLEAHRIDEREPGDGTRITRHHADEIIGWVNRQIGVDNLRVLPTVGCKHRADRNGNCHNCGAEMFDPSLRDAKPAAAPARRPSDQPAEVGVYRHDGELYVVREFKPQGEDRKVRYARKLVQLRDTQGSRVNGAGAEVRYDEVKAPRMQFTLQPSELLSIEEVEALSIEFDSCLLCGHTIWTADSINKRHGIGPVCYGKQTSALALAGR